MAELFKVVTNDLMKGADFPSEVTEENALDLSIAKWQTIADWAEVQNAKEDGYLIHDGGRYTCGLCLTYERGGCNGCPVNEVTSNACAGTHYSAYLEAYEVGDVEEGFIAARSELNFLRSLK